LGEPGKPKGGPGMQKAGGIQFDFWILAPAPDPDPGFAGMTTRGKPRAIKPKRN
jgi:hypothetical protein